MRSALERPTGGDLAAGDENVSGAAPGSDLISTPDAAALMGLSEATLRNYAWLNSLSPQARANQKRQEPPAGLPIPTRKSGRLFWPLEDVMRFAGQKSKPSE
jgi:hypothetical protein